MSNAFMGKILRVSLSDGTISEENLRLDWAKKFIGGAGLATRYLYDEVPRGVDPLGPENKLIFMTGPLTGTASASAARYSVVSKSPLTGIWGHGNSGGSFGPALKQSGYDGIIFEGVSTTPVYLRIIDGQPELCDAVQLWGKIVPETEDLIQETYEKNLTIASIGPGGENLVRYAAIMNNKHRAVGRCGLGTVMGAKRLKAVACGGKADIKLENKDTFRKIARKQIELLDESLLKVGFDAFGTNMLSDMVNARGGYPTRNWQEGVFESIEEVNGQTLTDKVFVKGVNCFACPISCGRRTEIREGQWEGHRGEGPEYETVNTLGAQCGVADMNAITMANYLCNEYGLDTITTGSSIAFAMECYEKGILTNDQTDGLELTFGNSELVVHLIDKIAKREGIGDLLAEGTKIMSQKLGHGSEHFAMHVKGLELPAYDPRAAKITGLGYVTANRGGDHITAYVQGPTFIDLPFLLVEDSTIKDPFVADPMEAKVVVDMENALTMFDCIGGCKFMGILLPAEDYVQLISHATGWDFGEKDFRKSGERVYNLMRAFCVREGITRESDTLPKRLMEDPLPEGPARGMRIDKDTLEMLKDAYYDLRGWDKTTGKPTVEKLKELELEDIIEGVWGTSMNS
ncbi:MAG: aldehyde ferredoxin oxidoreductase family protein [Deltaproteobacteria bacterium]|nr:aldehyde ferredoxin oxidoreductase family protein [Deltaproteobacteria bacterium]